MGAIDTVQPGASDALFVQHSELSQRHERLLGPALRTDTSKMLRLPA